jgi:hypothetical protein
MSISVKVSGTKEAQNAIDKEVIEAINTLQRASAFAAVSDLINNTPVDTGRARGSWSLNKTKNLVDTESNGTSLPVTLGPIPKEVVETLYITNGTPYIQQLNAGSSQQAPPRFIEKTLSNYFSTSGGTFLTVK